MSFDFCTHPTPRAPDRRSRWLCLFVPARTAAAPLKILAIVDLAVAELAKVCLFVPMRKWQKVRKPLKGFGVPGGIRTRVTAVKGRCPRPG